jgi:hypothetical protein
LCGNSCFFTPKFSTYNTNSCFSRQNLTCTIQIPVFHVKLLLFYAKF